MHNLRKSFKINIVLRYFTRWIRR